MKRKQIARIVVDVLMTAVLLLLMAYSLVGETTHEWLGIGMGVLFVCHHVLNRRWSRNLLKGKYSPYRILQATLAALVMLTMLGSMVSGIFLSRHALGSFPARPAQAWARTVHMLSAYWGFVFMSLHLGLHWNTTMSMAGKLFKGPSPVRSGIVRMIGVIIAGYGLYAFFKREIGSYIFLRNQFVFFDYTEPLILFLLDYIAVMGLFVCLGHYLAKAARRR